MEFTAAAGTEAWDTLTFSGLGTYLDKVVLYVEIPHTESQDLDIRLKSPSGTIVDVSGTEIVSSGGLARSAVVLPFLPAVNGALFVGFAVYFGIFSIFFFIALYLDEALSYSGARIAGVFAPMAVAVVLGSTLGGRWVARRGTRSPMAASTASRGSVV